MGGWGLGWLGVPPHTCTCRCMHAHTCMHGKHDNFMQMATPMGESLGIPYDVICVSACVWGTLLPPPYPSTHLPTPQGRTPGISKNSIALELIEIFQFCLKI